MHRAETLQEAFLSGSLLFKAERTWYRRPLWIYRRFVWPIIEVYVEHIWCNDSLFFFSCSADLDNFAPAPWTRAWILSWFLAASFIRSAPKGRSHGGKESFTWPHLHENHTWGYWDNSVRKSNNAHLLIRDNSRVNSVGLTHFLLVRTEIILSPGDFGHISPQEWNSARRDLCIIWREDTRVTHNVRMVYFVSK